MGDETESRFFRLSDPRSDEVLYKIPEVWWSRLYEYEWAKRFVRPGDVVLDAASGITHPFKFYLTTVAAEVHACDIDPAIADPARIVEAIRNSWFGPAVAAEIESRYISLVKLAHGDLTQLPYADEQFDLIYCISVLEELPQEAQLAAFKQFRRVLKADGRLVVTFDYPDIDLEGLRSTLKEAGLGFAGPVDFELPPDAVYTPMWNGLYCFRALLRKVQP